MKRIVVCILLSLFALTFVGCGNAYIEDQNNESYSKTELAADNKELQSPAA